MLLKTPEAEGRSATTAQFLWHKAPAASLDRWLKVAIDSTSMDESTPGTLGSITYWSGSGLRNVKADGMRVVPYPIDAVITGLGDIPVYNGGMRVLKPIHWAES
ncbi:hypothetical protein [Pyrobaculum islandicum]|uniref:hypothetical protein n=1 Tax=Pyrobaculum islandicum TaxID=2277 RepID=UPI00069DA227|nr:hypothetical protein [Pyrobaculum islandicum]